MVAGDQETWADEGTRLAAVGEVTAVMGIMTYVAKAVNY